MRPQRAGNGAGRPMPLPTLAEAEAAVGRPARSWAGRCSEVSDRLLASGLVRGVARYGLYLGPVAPGGLFSPTAPWHRHGWIEAPGRLVVDPTRWAFERADPYLYQGPYTDAYDPEMAHFARIGIPPPPGRRPGDRAVDLDLGPAARAHLRGMTGSGCVFSRAQLAWLAGLPPPLLGLYAAETYRAMDRAGCGGMIPPDRWWSVAGDPLW
jgi:hypothetical protein